MNIEEEKCSGCSLLTEAYNQLENCCESACDKHYIRSYIKYLENKIVELEDELNGRTD